MSKEDALQNVAAWLVSYAERFGLAFYDDDATRPATEDEHHGLVRDLITLGLVVSATDIAGLEPAPVAEDGGKCDGDHAGPTCADLECWRRDNMTSNDYQAIVDLCEREGWHWSIQAWGEGAQLQLQRGSYTGPVVAEINGRSIADLRRRVNERHAAALKEPGYGRVLAHEMKPPAPSLKTSTHIIDLARTLKKSIEADQ